MAGKTTRVCLRAGVHVCVVEDAEGQQQYCRVGTGIPAFTWVFACGLKAEHHVDVLVQ